jgi:hypothetical protein
MAFALGGRQQVDDIGPNVGHALEDCAVIVALGYALVILRKWIAPANRGQHHSHS